MSAGNFHAAALTKNGNLYLWGSNTTGQLGMSVNAEHTKPTILPPFEDSPASIVSCCANHTIVVLKNGALYTFGKGAHGALGHNDRHNRLVPTRIEPLHFANAHIVSAAAGTRHSTAVTKEGFLYTWGEAEGLGHADEQTKFVPTRIAARLLHTAPIGRGTTCPQRTPSPLPWARIPASAAAARRRRVQVQEAADRGGRSGRETMG